MFIFYDIETTGTNLEFDQVLQFAAILVDANLAELDRFEIRCQLLPWIVPSPQALLVTNTDVGKLTDKELPNFFDMMHLIREKLVSWGSAIYIGYNSIRFDEPFLQRAFWQTLNPPYLTVTNGNSRTDLLPIVRAIYHKYPECLSWPKDDNEVVSFKLDRLAPYNGFNQHNAHDALGDVEATLYIARLIKEGCPQLWKIITSRTLKGDVSDILSHGKIIFFVEHFSGKDSSWFGQRIDQSLKSSYAYVARLDYDWAMFFKGESLDEGIIKSTTPKIIRKFALNKSPLMFTVSEAQRLFQLSPSADELERSSLVYSNQSFFEKVVDEVREFPIGNEKQELEQMIYQGFPSREDESLLKKFSISNWHERVQLISLFEDAILRQLARRLVYISSSELLDNEDREKIKLGIIKRLMPDKDSSRGWRSIPDALSEITDIKNLDQFNLNKVEAIEKWLIDLQSKYSAQVL